MGILTAVSAVPEAIRNSSAVVPQQRAMKSSRSWTRLKILGASLCGQVNPKSMQTRLSWTQKNNEKHLRSEMTHDLREDTLPIDARLDLRASLGARVRLFAATTVKIYLLVAFWVLDFLVKRYIYIYIEKDRIAGQSLAFEKMFGKSWNSIVSP